MKPVVSVLLAALAVASTAHAQLTHEGCEPLKPEDFTKTALFGRSASLNVPQDASLAEPVAMAFDAVRAGDSVVGADIYLVQREGSVRKYDHASKTVRQIGFIDNEEAKVSGNGDNGVMGIALDPAFKTNRHVYIWYIPPRVGQNNYRGRLSRFTLGANDTLDVATEKNLIDIKLSKTRQWHSGGPMRFDAHGDLWVTIGNNGNDLNANTTLGSQYSPTDSNANQEWGSSNTASMRGGVIRIHPDNSEKGYSIPEGNFGAHWAAHFENLGNTALAAEYRDPAKVLPEIYVKGTRSNYSISVHPTKRWLAWGEVNWERAHDEFNLITKPAFTGFPYFHANNQATPGGISVPKDTLAPTNTSVMNSGVTQLPPAQSAVLWYGASVTARTLPTNVAIGGDIYVYNPSLKSSAKFPPHFHNSLLLMSWQANSMYAVKIDSTTVSVASTPLRIDNSSLLGLTASPTNLRNPVQASYGPDGALYILNYGGDYNTNNNPGVLRVAYNGICKVEPASISAARPLSELRMTLRGSRLQVLAAGRHDVSLLTASGREVFRASGDAGAVHDFGAKGLRGVYLLRVKTAEGVFARNVPLL